MSEFRFHLRSLALTSTTLALFAGAAGAHVTLQAPNGGEVLPGGSTFTVQWTIDISHNLQNWDLWYSTTGASGPWIPIAVDLAPGSGAVGSAHSFDWVVPDTPSAQVRVRVRMRVRVRVRARVRARARAHELTTNSLEHLYFNLHHMSGAS